MAFEDIKARLGLNIDNFKKGLLFAKNSIRDFSKQAGGKAFAALGPVALLAGLTNAINKAQELRRKADEAGEALDPAVRKTAELGDNLDRAKGFLMDMATAGLSRVYSVLDNITASIVTALNPNITKEQYLEQARQERNAEARARASERVAKQESEREKEDIARIKKAFDEASRDREAASLKQLSLADQIKLKEKQAAAELRKYNDESLSSVQRAEALARARKLELDLVDMLAKQQEGIANAAAEKANKEKQRLATLKAQVEALRAQGRAMRDNIANTRRRGELPSMAEVISGQRNIGSVGRNRASALERARATALRLSDAEQRAREAFSGATTESARANALRQGRGIRSQLDAARSAIAAGEQALGSRIADADPFRDQLTELKSIAAELKKLNEQTLAPTPTPVSK